MPVQFVNALHARIARGYLAKGVQQFVMVGPALQMLGGQLAQIMGFGVSQRATFGGAVFDLTVEGAEEIRVVLQEIVREIDAQW